MTAQPHRSLLSVEEYLELDQSSTDARYEYIDGRAMMLAGGTLDHTSISFNIARTMHALLQKTGCRVYTAGARVRVSETCYLYPDITITCDERDSGQAVSIVFPRVVVEVLSPSTEGFDRGKKFQLYRECPTIQEYIFVNTAYPAVEVLRREKKDLWIIQIFTPGSFVELQHLGIRFPVSAIYEGITFPDE